MLKSGEMMERPLLVSSILDHAEKNFGTQEISSHETSGALFRYTYAECAQRVRQLANALKALGLQPGDVVGSIAWNNHRHLESYYAISGSGMVVHTSNPRLHPEQLIYVINHAEDKVVMFDASFAPLIQVIAPHCPLVQAWICLTGQEHMIKVVGVEKVFCYEDLLAAESTAFQFPEFDERSAAALCYTSGTTGNPKGVLYSHRAIVLNALVGCTPDVLGLSSQDAVLPVVPMFHINAWCIPYAALIAGAKLVLPGPRLDGKSLYELMEAESVTVSAGVPTIWMLLIQHLDQHSLRFSTLNRTCVGGSAMPPALIAKFSNNYGVEVRHGWGMTETTAASTMTNLTSSDRQSPPEHRNALVAKQGKALFGTELKVVDENGHTLPCDGSSQGELMIRGQWILSGYYKSDAQALVDGWFPTGDIATLDPNGLMQIRDRTKDVIKSGGEWISSIDLENAATSHPAVAMAAVIGVNHPKWGERPLLLLVRKPGQTVGQSDILQFLEAKVAKWWVPDHVVFLDNLPLGGTGKVQKGELRKQYGTVFETIE